MCDDFLHYIIMVNSASEKLSHYKEHCVCEKVIVCHVCVWCVYAAHNAALLRQLGCEGEKHKTSVIRPKYHRVHTTHTTGGVNKIIHRKIASEKGVRERES